MKAAEAVVDIMKDWGVEHVYGYPGDSVNNLVEALRKHQEEIDFVHVRHEEVGALAASAEAKLTGKVGVCLSIGGPGAIHMLNGMYDAKADGAPMVAITGQISHDLVGTDNFQEVNLERAFDGVATFNRRVTSGKQMRPLLQQAFKEAYANKGVAVLTVPDDVFTETVEKPTLRNGTYSAPRYVPSLQDLEASKKMIEKAKKPVILAGKGAFPAQAYLGEFAEKIAAPVIVTLRGKGVIPDKHPYNLGNHGQIGTKPAYEAMEDTDLLIMIGTSYPYREFLPKNAPAIQIDNDPTQIGKRYPVDIGLVASSEVVVSWFNEHLERKENRRFLKSCQENMANWWQHLEDIASGGNHEHMQGPTVIRRLQEYVDEDAIVSVDVGNVTTWVTRFFETARQRLIFSSSLATMGAGLPGAIAAKIKEPDKQVVAICGDGGFSMVMHDFLTAVQYDLPMTIVIMNNKKIGMIKFEQEEMGNLPYQIPLKDMDYAAFAKACDGDGYRVNNETELIEALQAAKTSNKPTIIDAVIEERAPLPGKIEWGQAKGYSKYVFKKLVENKKEHDMPSLKTIFKRMV